MTTPADVAGLEDLVEVARELGDEQLAAVLAFARAVARRGLRGALLAWVVLLAEGRA